MRSSVILKICLREKIDLWRQRACDNISIPDAPKQMRNIPPSSITKIEISQKVVADNGLKLKVYKESTLDLYSVEEIRQKDIVDTVILICSVHRIIELTKWKERDNRRIINGSKILNYEKEYCIDIISRYNFGIDFLFGNLPFNRLCIRVRSLETGSAIILLYVH